ncbi:MAG TPA: hypothetical protein VMR25_19790 [Planctomycetaceae bacterium]|nr:hypothetical protein [Planctomycetaceae bacterium]
MTSEPHSAAKEGVSPRENSVEVPRPTVAPLVVGLGTTLLLAGFALGAALSVVGGLILVFGVGAWIASLLPGRGHVWEALAAAEPRSIVATTGAVERLEQGMPGYRMRLPEKVHPISAGVEGGLLGGLVMPLPALVYALSSGHGIWYPLNLLAGIALPGVGHMSTAELEQFNFSLFIVGAGVHVAMSAMLGLLYGVLMPTLPDIPKPLAWGGVLMPLLWTAVSYSFMAVVNPALNNGVDWPWFIASQFIFGVVTALVVMRLRDRLSRPVAGALGGLCGGLLMPGPAVIWSLASGHGLWYPANLLAGMVRHGMDRLTVEQLMQFNRDWLGTAVVIHVVMSLSLGLLYGILLTRLRPIPGPFVWGGVLMPLLWTAASYSLMGVVNPLLQDRVNWPWFVVSQFVFGIVAAIAIVRSEEILVPPAGRTR